MSGFNGSGPAGKGPMTGRGRGYCLSYVGEEGHPGPWPGRGGGRGWRHRSHATGNPGRAAFACSLYDLPAGVRQELDILREQVSHLQKDLEKAKKRMDELGIKE